MLFVTWTISTNASQLIYWPTIIENNLIIMHKIRKQSSFTNKTFSAEFIFWMVEGIYPTVQYTTSVEYTIPVQYTHLYSIRHPPTSSLLFHLQSDPLFPLSIFFLLLYSLFSLTSASFHLLTTSFLSSCSFGCLSIAIR